MIMSIWSGAFWKAATERAISTAAQAAAAFIFVDSVQVNAFTLDWPTIGGIAAGGALFSLLKSLVANGATGTGPSLTNAEQTIQPPAASGDDYGPGDGDLDPIDRDSR